jgi:LPXTG-motif cell wall-anchored protein
VTSRKPPEPQWLDNCGTENDGWIQPVDTMGWSYFATAPTLTPEGEAIDPGYVYAQNAAGQTYYPVWELTAYLTDEPCTEEPGSEAPVTEVPATPPPLTELPATGAETGWAFAAAVLLVAAGLVIKRMVRHDH